MLAQAGGKRPAVVQGRPHGVEWQVDAALLNGSVAIATAPTLDSSPRSPGRI